MTKLTLKEMAGKSIAGKTRLGAEVKRVIQEYGVAHIDRFGPAKLYSLDDVEDAFRKYDSAEETVPVENDEMANLRKLKIAKEIEILTSDLVKKDLQIEQLRNTLIDKDDVRDYLIVRQGIENSLLRRILFVQLPIEIPGLSIAKAREKSEGYYNQIMDAMTKTTSTWKKKYGSEDNYKLEETIRKIVNNINTPSGSFAPPTTGSCSGSIDPNQSQNSGSANS